MPDMSDMLIFGVVVMARFLIPLAIPTYPLPAIIATLILDTLDQTIFQQFTSLPLEGYQSYDKALDIYYLAITYLSTLRNWSNFFAFEVARFLFYYRLVGVALFELINVRVLLLVFPNIFEYFFIFYEIIRLKWNPVALTKEKLIITTALIWIFIKFPQEYWIHVAQMDTTDWIKANPPNVLVIIIWALFLLGIAWGLLRDLPAMKSGFSIVADYRNFRFDSPLAKSIRDNYTSKEFFDDFIHYELVEKTALVSLLCIIFAQILPGVLANNIQLAVGVSFLIVINTELSQWLVRRGTLWKSIIWEFLVTTVVNFSIVLIYDFLIARYEGSIYLFDTLFFALLLSLNVTLYDRYRRAHIWSMAVDLTGLEVKE